MEPLTSACGVYDCEACEHRASEQCIGCRTGNLALSEDGSESCGVFACVQSKGISDCASCPEQSCTLRRTAESICPLRGRFENKRWWAGRMAHALASRRQPPDSGEPKTSERVVGRLHRYLSALDALAADGVVSVSSWQLAEKVGVNAALIRKDLSRFGDFGRPSYGYRVDFLGQRIRDILRLDNPRYVVWIGAACYRLHTGVPEKLAKHRCRVLAVFDTEAAEIGTTAADREVLPAEQLAAYCGEHTVDAAAVAVPGPDAQSIADTLVKCGVRGILNLSGEPLVLPGHVRVSNFDLVGELLELSYYCG